MKSNLVLPALALLSTLTLSPVAFGHTIFDVNFEDGAPDGDVPTAENAIPVDKAGTDLTYVLKAPNVTFKVAEGAAFPGKYALLTDTGKTNASFFCRWAEDAEDKVIGSGVLTVSWKMNFVSGSDGDVSFQILRSDLAKDAARLARLNINSSGSIKIGGSTQAGPANDSRVSKNNTLNTPHTYVWTLDYATGVQTLKVDGGSLLDYTSQASPEQNFFKGAPSLALKVEVRGDSAVVAFDDILITHTGGDAKP